MSIKSDRWIRRMAREHRMIEPFAAEQVRAVGGHKIVSYGTSSYGYDVRCAPEFKIFTNINSTIVDPKAFDEKSFVDFPGEVCIIPPNSFALARTVEYFRIPRSVLTVCLGKCLTADARVVDAQSGAYVPITEMRFGSSTLALDRLRLRSAKVSAFVPQGRKEVFRLTTRAGLQICATANHPFLMRRGWVPLECLHPGDRIGAAAQIPLFGKTALADWRATLLGLMIGGGRCAPGEAPSYTTADPALRALLQSAVAGAGFAQVCDSGRDRYRLKSHGGREGFAAPNCLQSWLAQCGLYELADAGVPQAIFMAPAQAVRLFLQALLSGGADPCADEESGLFRTKSRRLIDDVHHLLLRFGVFARIRAASESLTPAFTLQIPDAAQMKRFAGQVGFVPGSVRQRRLDEQVLRLNASDSLPRALLQSAHAAGGARTCPPRGAGELARPAAQGLSPGPVWDEVDSIEPAGVQEVFDISVPILHNFLANGLIVHNSTYARCGIICNVTPLEPEWEGHVTLEFSNTTPLPAKIYANEGVAQMLFFESDELCETSYRDRGGKYMGQKGVTLPKA